MVLFAVAWCFALIMFGHLENNYRVVGRLLWPLLLTEYPYTETGKKYFRRFWAFLLLSIAFEAVFFVSIWALPEPAEIPGT